MDRRRGVKIVATIGPASCDAENLERMFLEGVDVFRLNFSHGSHDGHASVYKSIRNIGEKYRRSPSILADLQGPKLRVGTFENDKIILEKEDIFRFDLDQTPGNTRRVNLPHPEILEVLTVGACLLLDDGKLRFEVLSCDPEQAEVKVLVGGQLSNRKGVNVPNIMLPISALTKKDLVDMDFALGLGVDWVALSFVQRVQDVEQARKIIDGRAGIVVKLEKPLAIESLEPIVAVADGVMIARGDLGVEMNPEDVPTIQRRVIDVCHRMGRPVIVATQMLESMISTPSPTRAEVSDVATAVYCGADATMLSAESASGQYPLEAVEIMSRIISKTESDPLYQRIRAEENSRFPDRTVVDAFCLAAKNAAEFCEADAIVLFTNSFDSVVRCSRMRPAVPVLLITNSETVAGRAGLCYGVHAILVREKDWRREDMPKMARAAVRECEFASAGDRIILLDDIFDHSITLISRS
ncbi:MAG: pyruvate kinase [Holosporaceae bacterium]|jgi:pyruvate kinase|nr:pyruvate kinase [Holosporaceae bacterium]